jgi:hypothetical protein
VEEQIITRGWGWDVYGVYGLTGSNRGNAHEETNNPNERSKAASLRGADHVLYSLLGHHAPVWICGWIAKSVAIGWLNPSTSR